MKISKSKQELARIIRENGGWREGAEFAAQDKKSYSLPNMFWFYTDKPKRVESASGWRGQNVGDGVEASGLIKNWHQTILSREEYFNLYPATDANPEFCESVMRSIQEPEIHSKNTALTQVDDIDVVESKPTIEQLAADYRNAKDYADRKQEEADAAKADADEALRKLVAAGKEFGLVLSVAAPEPELVITDWRDLLVGDVVEVTGSSNYKWHKVKGKELTVKSVRGDGASTGEWLVRGNTEFRFIRRP